MRIKLLAPLLAFGLLVGCARSPVTPVQQAPVARFMVVPVAPIDKMHTENKGIPLGVLWQSLADRIKSTDFNERMEADDVPVCLFKPSKREVHGSVQ